MKVEEKKLVKFQAKFSTLYTPLEHLHKEQVCDSLFHVMWKQ